MASRTYAPRHSAAAKKRPAQQADTLTPATASPSRGAARRLGATAAVATTVGATAAAAITALAAPANASDRYWVWDRVASCESSNNWHINTGNGFYGGLQFSASTWAAYGGHRYAGQANGASRIEQIEVARRVLASQGPGAWPVCSVRAGLTRSNGYATSSALPGVAGSGSHHGTHHSSSHHSSHHRYRVRSGDTLSIIAHRFHVRGGWRAIWRLNRSHIHNPNVIRVGQVLRLP